MYSFLCISSILNLKILFKRTLILLITVWHTVVRFWCFVTLLLPEICWQVKFVFLHLFNFFVVALDCSGIFTPSTIRLDKSEGTLDDCYHWILFKKEKQPQNIGHFLFWVFFFSIQRAETGLCVNVKFKDNDHCVCP